MTNHIKKYLPGIILAALIVFSFFTIKPFLTTLLMGALLAFITYPFYKFILRRIPHKTVAAIIVCLLVLIILIVPLIVIIKLLVQEASSLFMVIKETPTVELFKTCERSFCRSLKSLWSNPHFQNQIQEWLVHQKQLPPVLFHWTNVSVHHQNRLTKKNNR